MSETSVLWIAQHLRRGGWRVAKEEWIADAGRGGRVVKPDSERADADFLISYMDRDECLQDEPQGLTWLSVVARHELWMHGVEDDVAECWRAVRPRAEVAAEHAAIVEAMWQTPEGKRLHVALGWSHCDLARKAVGEWSALYFARSEGKPLPPTPTLDAFGEILMTFRRITEQEAADHLGWIDNMLSATGKIGSMFAEVKQRKAEQGLTGPVLVTWNGDGQMELLPRDDP